MCLCYWNGLINSTVFHPECYSFYTELNERAMSNSLVANFMTRSAKSDKEVMEGLEETRSRLCKQFVTVTGSDSAMAQVYLAENDWNLEVRLNLG